MFIDNNISQGYKQTELGIIPEDWEVLSFSQVFDMYPNNTYPRDCMNDDHGTIRNIHYGDVLIKYPTVVDVDKCSIPYLNEGVKIKNQKFVQSGDVIIADTAEDETVGKCVEIKNAINAKIVAGLHTFFCRPIRKFAIGWLGYYLNSSNYHNQLLPYITGIKVSSISRGSIQETKLLVPPVAEQRAIAEALNDIDPPRTKRRVYFPHPPCLARPSIPQAEKQSAFGTGLPEGKKRNLNLYRHERNEQDRRNDGRGGNAPGQEIQIHVAGAAAIGLRVLPRFR